MLEWILNRTLDASEGFSYSINWMDLRKLIKTFTNVNLENFSLKMFWLKCSQMLVEKFQKWIWNDQCGNALKKNKWNLLMCM